MLARCTVLLAGLALASAAMAPAPAPSMGPTGPIKLVPLPYAYDALEPVIDKETVRIHHDLHQQAYVTNLNTALATPLGVPLSNLTLGAMVAAVNTSALPPSLQTGVRNNAGGNANHILYWKVMTSPSNATGMPVGTLASAINSTFGNFTSFKTQFNTAGAGRFGSGFVWLVLQKNGSLAITSTANQDSPLMTGLGGVTGIPIIGNDVWEHAYYLKYQNKRPMYLSEWWKVVNWPVAEDNYLQAQQGNSVFATS